MFCLRNIGAEIGEFLTHVIFLSYSYKKRTLSIMFKEILLIGVPDGVCPGLKQIRGY